MKLFAVSAPGLESFTAQELLALGLLPPAAATGGPQPERRSFPDVNAEDEDGGVSFEGAPLAVYRANLHLRTSNRVLARLGDFYAASFPELRKKAARLEWERYLAPGQSVALRVTCHKSRLYHSEAVAERVAGAISDRLGKSTPREKFDEKSTAPAQLVIVRLLHDHCTISIDSSGALLHRRGYRLATAKAPLRETLAAGMLLASGWDRRAPLLDPFCGSGTIAIEAAQMALGIPAGMAAGTARHFAFMDWPGFQIAQWQAVLAEATQGIDTLRSTPPLIQASDRDAGAIQLAQANAERAGVTDYIQFSCRAVSAIQPQGMGWVVTNPPYGLRVSAHKDLRNLYAQFGKVLRSLCPGWQVAILCSEEGLLHQVGLHLDTSLRWVNGGVTVRLGRGEVK